MCVCFGGGGGLKQKSSVHIIQPHKIHSLFWPNHQGAAQPHWFSTLEQKQKGGNGCMLTQKAAHTQPGSPSPQQDGLF